MEDAERKLLQECNAGAKMAVKSIDQVCEHASDGKLLDLLSAYKDKHKEIEKETTELLEGDGQKTKEPGVMASAFAKTSTGVKLMMQEDSSQIAKIMMDGCNMGIQAISEKVNAYPSASEKSRKIARKLIQIEEDFMEEMKAFC